MEQKFPAYISKVSFVDTKTQFKELKNPHNM